MTDYLEELLDQLEEEEADVAAHWPEDLAPTWAEFPGGAEPRGETRTTGRSPVTALPEAVWTEAWEALESPEAVESALLPGPPETWTVARGPVPPEKEPTDAHIPEFLEAAAWPAPQPDALEEADGRKSERPALLERAAVLAEWLRGLDYTALKKLLACNDSIAELNFRRFQEMDLRRPGTPALLSYDGIQYQYMAPHLFTRPQFEYAETHLRILSGFYGVLRPFDGVLPYRLEMGARCSTPFCKNLYDFWGDSLYRTLTAGGEDTLLNLASAEYAKAVRPWVTPPVRWIDVTFGEADGDKVVEKGGYVKMARGEMVRFLAERNAETPEAAQGFDRLGYRFSPAHSTAASYVFLREGRAN